MAYTFFDCTLIRIINESDIVKRFFIKIPESIPFNFKAGQFVMVDLPVDVTPVDRAYSIACPPADDHIIELAVVLSPGGIGSTYLFNEVSEGSLMKVSKPLGKFTLPPAITTDLCFICTGTGIAPLRSMMLHILRARMEHKNLYLVFGNRWEKDILYRQEFEKLEQLHPELKFIPVLSRDNLGWKGRTGYVHAVYEELFADKRDAVFYICGWREMINDARKRLAVLGYHKTQIRFELYD